MWFSKHEGRVTSSATKFTSSVMEIRQLVENYCGEILRHKHEYAMSTFLYKEKYAENRYFI